LSLSVDFYIRVFVRIYDSPVEVKRSLLRRTMVHQSVQCESFYCQPMGSTHKSKKGGGDLYSGAHVTVRICIFIHACTCTWSGLVWSVFSLLLPHLLSVLLPLHYSYFYSTIILTFTLTLIVPLTNFYPHALILILILTHTHRCQVHVQKLEVQ
jgi:hypothetical protein